MALKAKGKKKMTDEEKRLAKLNTWTFTRAVAVAMGMGERIKAKVAEQKAMDPALNEGPAAARMILQNMKGPYIANKEGVNLLYGNAVKAFMEEGAPHLTAENKDKITRSWLEEQAAANPTIKTFLEALEAPFDQEE